MSKTLTYIDPPSGWKYGFPKIFDKPKGTSLEEWLISKGYPEMEIPLALKWSRYWTEEKR